MPKKKKSDFIKTLNVESPIRGLSSKENPMSRRKKKGLRPPSIFKSRY